MSVTRPLVWRAVSTAAKSTKWMNLSTSRCISTSRFMLAKVTVNVPALGESISEGSISSFEKAVGDVVDVDDVVAVIETDKVTVDIKSPYKGVLVEVLCGESDEISVGSPLYTIDTDDNIVITPPQEKITEVPTSLPQASTTSPSPKNKSKRIPLIKFLGKRSLLKNKKTPPQTDSSLSIPSLNPVESQYDNYDAATLGRPLLTDAEIDAVESGGASLFA